MPLRKTG